MHIWHKRSLAFRDKLKRMCWSEVKDQGHFLPGFIYQIQEQKRKLDSLFNNVFFLSQAKPAKRGSATASFGELSKISRPNNTDKS